MSPDFSLRQIIGIAGSIVLFIGVFAPMIGGPGVGHMNYFQCGMCNGVIIFALAIGSAVLTTKEIFKGLWFTGFGSLGVVIFTSINIHSNMAEAAEFMNTALGKNLDKLLGGALSSGPETIHFKWGLAVLVLGAVMILVSAGMGMMKKKGEKRMKGAGL